MSSIPSSSPDNYRQFHKLFRSVADALHVPLEEMQDSQHQLLDILHASVPARVMLPINDAILQPACTVWHTPDTCTPTLKGAEKRCYVPTKESEFLFSHPTPNFLVTQIASERARQQYRCSSPTEKDGKRLDLLSHKVFSSASLQFQISNYLA